MNTNVPDNFEELGWKIKPAGVQEGGVPEEELLQGKVDEQKWKAINSETGKIASTSTKDIKIILEEGCGGMDIAA